MFKRVTWFVTGAAAGVGGSLYAKRRVQQAIDRLTPEYVQEAAKAKARAVGDTVADAVREGRQAMREREAELRGEPSPLGRAIDTTARVAEPAAAAIEAAARAVAPALNPVRRQRAAQ